MGKNGIRSVAELAGVSIGTVSKILNPSSSANIRVSAETREKVLAAVEKLDYRPSYGAKLLRGESTRTIGFAISMPKDHNVAYLSSYTFRLLNGIGHEASMKGYQVLLLNGVDYRCFMNIKRVDALIMINFALSSNPEQEQMREMFELFNERHYPYVVINREPGEEKMPKIPLIRVDNASGMRQVADFIVRKGYSTVGFVGELTSNPQQHHLDRCRFLAEYLAGTPCRLLPGAVLNGSGGGIPDVPRVGRYSHDEGRVALRYLMEKKCVPRCLVCGDDDIAMGVLKAAIEAGIRVPEELAVIGFDDDQNTDYLNPALTTVHQPLEEFGRLAVDYVLAKMEEPEKLIELVIEPKLIERESA